MSGYVPNNRKQRPIPPPEPYNGDFDRQPPRPLEGVVRTPDRCLIGLRFVWDNGESLGANLPYSLFPSSGNVMRGGLDARGSLIQTIEGRGYQAQLLVDADVDIEITRARTELQAVLEEILAAERAEAARLQAIQDQRSTVSNYLHRRLAAGKGFFLSAWGLIKTVKELSDLVSPFTAFSNALRSAWQARSSHGESWLAAYNRLFSAEQHRELVEALGFDPASITREQLAEAYELACFIHEDRQSKAILARFALDYAQAQNVEEVAEFSGGVLFEIILAALLVALTGGVGLAVRGAASVVRLGNVLKRLSTALKRARIKRGGQAQGSGTGAQTVEVERPAAVSPSPINALPLAPRRPVIVENDVIDRPRTGSANKTDSTHSFNDLIDNYAGDAQSFEIPTKGPGGVTARTSTLHQIEGSLNGKEGVFEWIIDQDHVTHRRFIPRGKVTGLPNQVPTP